MGRTKRPKTLREWRSSKGHTQASAAALIGVTQRSYSRYELGRVPRPEILFRLATITRVPLSVLAGIAGRS